MSLVISLEGIENCGATTQAELLRAYYSDKGLKANVVENPGVKTNRSLRSSLNGKYDKSVFYPELRDTERVDKDYLWEKIDLELEVSEEELFYQLKNADLHIIDKSYLTMLAYDGYGLLRNKNDIAKMKQKINDPAHKIFYLDSDIPSMIYREVKRSEPQEQIFNPNKNFYNRVIRGYRIESNDREDVIKIRNSSQKEVHDDLIRRVGELLEYNPNFYK